MANKKQYNAEQLDKRLEMMLRSEALLERADEHPDARIRAAARLAKSKPPPLSADARTRIRDRMRQHQPAPAQSASPPRETSVVRPAASYWQGLAKLAAAVVLVFALGLGSSTATANSLPGDVFYPVKRQIERIELNLAGNAAARADVYLTQANRRLSETDALLQRGEFRTDIFEEAASQLAQAVELAESNRLYTSESGLAADTRSTYDSLTRTLREAPASADITARVMSDLEQTVFALSMNTDVIQAPADMQPQTTPDASPEPAAEATAPVTSTALPTTDLPALDVETPAEIMTAVLTNTPAATATSTAAPVVVTDEPVQVLYVNATGRVNVRSGPGTAYDIIGSVSPGMALNVTGSSDGWQQVSYDGGDGWIASFLLSESEPVITDTDDDNGDDNNDNNDSPGNSDFGCDQPGNACNAPGQSGDNPGQGSNPPGQSGDNPGQGGNPPGQSGDNPGQGGNPPGQGGRP